MQLIHQRATGFMGSRVGDRVDDFFERLSILAGTSLHKEGDRGSPKEDQMSPQEPVLAQKTNLWLPKGKVGGGRINQEFGINRYTLLYIKQINNKDLLYSTGNHIQYLIINCKGKEYEKEYICIFIIESLCCTPETNTTLLFGYTPI